MNNEEIKELKKGLTLTASYYGKDLKPEVLQMMADDLSDLPFERVSQAFLTYRRDPKNKFFPLPAQIREIIQPTPSPKSEARELVERIKIAISKIGYMHSAEAKAFIGETGWRIVVGLGGWSRVCESNFIFNSGLIAQAIARGEDLVNFQGQITTGDRLTNDSDNYEELESQRAAE